MKTLILILCFIALSLVIVRVTLSLMDLIATTRKQRLYEKQRVLKIMLSQVGRVRYCGGLCDLAGAHLTAKQREVFMKILKSKPGRRVDPSDNYLWRPREVEPRRAWLESELKKINKELTKYDI